MQHGRPRRVIRKDQPDAREGQAGRDEETDRLVVPGKPVNAGGGKGPQLEVDATRSEGAEIGQPINSG
jgi:hypothetical protein